MGFSGNIPRVALFASLAAKDFRKDVQETPLRQPRRPRKSPIAVIIQQILPRVLKPKVKILAIRPSDGMENLGEMNFQKKKKTNIASPPYLLLNGQ